MEKQRENGAPSAAGLETEFLNGLRLLYRSRRLAADVGIPANDFAVEIHQLLSLGLSTCELRWLLSKGYAEHLLDTTLAGEEQRSVRPIAGFYFTTQSCLVLTSAGERFAQATVQHLENGQQVARTESPNTKRPFWNPETRELFYGKRFVKKLRSTARNQELILQAFQDQNWISPIRSPLRTTANENSAARLIKAVYLLNCGLRPRTIRFRSEKNGKIFWTAGEREPRKKMPVIPENRGSYRRNGDSDSRNNNRLR